MNRSLLCVVATIAIAASSGCGQSSGHGPPIGASHSVTPLPAIPIGAITKVASPDQLTRPIYAYMPTVANIHTLQDAANLINDQCMKSFNLPSIPTRLIGVDEAALASLRSHTNLYGFFDPSVASTKGYDMIHLPRSLPAETSQSEASVRNSRLVEIGRDPSGKTVSSFGGRAVPPGGCKAKAAEETGGDMPSLTPEDLPDGGPTIPYGDPRIVAANGAWSECMKAKGYHFSDPFEAAVAVENSLRAANSTSPIPGPPSAGEISQAEADIACKASTNLVGIDFAVQVAYDERYIDSHASVLAQYRTKLDDRIRKAAQIIAAGGAS